MNNTKTQNNLTVNDIPNIQIQFEEKYDSLDGALELNKILKGQSNNLPNLIKTEIHFLDGIGISNESAQRFIDIIFMLLNEILGYPKRYGQFEYARAEDLLQSIFKGVYK